MTKLEIDLGPLLNSAESRRAPPPNSLDDLLSSALESPTGLVLEYGDKAAAASMRFKFYRRRTALQASQVYAFDDLRFDITKAGDLTITKSALPPVRTL